jgi:hypothetical protein
MHFGALLAEEVKGTIGFSQVVGRLLLVLRLEHITTWMRLTGLVVL